MDPAANTWTNEPHLTVFYCDRCCGPLPNANCGGPNVRFVGCCANEVDAARLQGAYADGADGVLVMGCLGGACCAPPDEVEAFRRIHAGTLVLRRLGLDPVRLRRHWLAPREAATVPGLVAAFRRRLVTLNARRETRAGRPQSTLPEPVQAAQV